MIEKKRNRRKRQRYHGCYPHVTQEIVKTHGNMQKLWGKRKNMRKKGNKKKRSEEKREKVPRMHGRARSEL